MIPMEPGPWIARTAKVLYLVTVVPLAVYILWNTW